jgi:hypothetical protein
VSDIRQAFEDHIKTEVAAGNLLLNAWPLLERVDDGYLDLYVSHRWQSWKACCSAQFPHTPTPKY